MSVCWQLTNPAFLLLCLAATFDSLIISGTATFGAKLLQQFFLVDLSTAGTIMGEGRHRGCRRLQGNRGHGRGGEEGGRSPRQRVMQG